MKGRAHKKLVEGKGTSSDWGEEGNGAGRVGNCSAVARSLFVKSVLVFRNLDTEGACGERGSEKTKSCAPETGWKA